MSEPRVIQADYSNWRTVAGRKVLQLVFEVPIEQTADVMEKLGVPMPGENKWCAIALLDIGGCASGNGAGKHGNAPKQSSGSEAPTDQSGPTHTLTIAHTAEAGTSPRERDRRPFASLPLSQQAALRCDDVRFQRYLGVANKTEAGDYVRSHCRVTSRADLDNTSGKFALSRDAWLKLEHSFQEHLTDQQFAGARHG